MNFEKMAHEICAAVGGVDNIVSVTHCATRFRVVLMDDKLFDKATIEAIDGVIGTLKTGSQWQIVIGKTVNEFYNVFISLYKVEEGKKKKLSLKNVLADIGTYLQTSVGAIIPVMVGCGMIKAILSCLSAMGFVDSANATYTFLWGCADCVTYYFPVLLAYGAAKKLGCNQIVAMVLGLFMVNPTYTAALAAGTEMSLFGITVVPYTYSNQFLPILIAVAILSVVEKFLKKYMPDMLSMILVPMGSFFIMILVIFLGIGPLMTWFGNFILGPATWLAQYRYVVIPVLAMAWSIMTLFGVHGAVYHTVNLLYFAEFGYDPVCLTSYLCTHTSIGMVALMSAVLAKNKEDRQIGVSTGITMLFACISEPALFGVMLRDKRYYAAHLSAAFVSALYAGLSGLACFVVGTQACLPYIAAYVGEGSTWVEVILTVVICTVASVFFSLLYTGVFKKKETAA